MSQKHQPAFPLKSVIVFLVLSISVSFGPGAAAQDTLSPIPVISGIEMLKVGDRVPDFTIGDLSGKSFNMKTALDANKGILIFFWSIFCEPCKAELPVIQKLTVAYREKGIEFVGVVIDGAPMKDALSAYVNQEKFSFLTLIDELNPDESFKVSDPYGVAGTPTLYIIDKEGVVRFGKIGRASELELEKIIKSLL